MSFNRFQPGCCCGCPTCARGLPSFQPGVSGFVLTVSGVEPNGDAQTEICTGYNMSWYFTHPNNIFKAFGWGSFPGCVFWSDSPDSNGFTSTFIVAKEGYEQYIDGGGPVYPEYNLLASLPGTTWGAIVPYDGNGNMDCGFNPLDLDLLYSDPGLCIWDGATATIAFYHGASAPATTTTKKPCGCGQKIKNFAGSMVDFAKDGFSVVDHGEHDRRLAICSQCPHLTGNTCGLCGCFVEIKSWGRAWDCPDVPSRWLK